MTDGAGQAPSDRLQARSRAPHDVRRASAWDSSTLAALKGVQQTRILVAHYPGAEIRYIRGFKTKAEVDEWLAGSRRIDWLRSGALEAGRAGQIRQRPQPVRCGEGQGLARNPRDADPTSRMAAALCTRCGIIGADARPYWHEQPPRETLTGAQWQ
jgi:hypothetical protein